MTLKVSWKPLGPITQKEHCNGITVLVMKGLIDFSNRYFYDSELVIFPSPWAQSDEFGVKFTHVTNGVFISGVNNEEAKSIVEAIKNHFIYHIDESLGVVAMNSKQREQIESGV